MDPDVCLEELLGVVDGIQALVDRGDVTGKDAELRDRGIRAGELVKALDGWLVGGGFLPQRWMRGGVRFP